MSGANLTSAPIPAPTPLLEIRTGRVARLADTTHRSAIDKQPRHGPVSIGTLGVEGDRQAATRIHGGPEMAVLHYAAAHYLLWRRELPDSADRLVPGGFGENLVSGDLDETNVCLGDVFRIGGAVLQICQPRQPCFKLNHRFGDATMARRAQETGRTGWYYRVVEPGEAAAGDMIGLVERPHPDWTIRRMQHCLYDRALALEPALLRELIALPPLAAAMRAIFCKRHDAGTVESARSRLNDSRIAVTPAKAVTRRG